MRLTHSISSITLEIPRRASINVVDLLGGLAIIGVFYSLIM